METFNCPLLIFKIIILFLYRDKNISVDDFSLIGFLGKGAYGGVYKVQKKSSGDFYAMKVIDYSQTDDPNYI